MSYFEMRHVRSCEVHVTCPLSDLSRIYWDTGAKLNVPKPLPQRQMPMARARLVVKYGALTNQNRALGVMTNESPVLPDHHAGDVHQPEPQPSHNAINKGIIRTQ